MFTYSKIYIFRNNSGITWGNWCCSCFTCCYRCGLGNHHSLWALASFILSLNCWSFCWFWLKSQIHRRIYRILWVERVLWWILLWNKSSTWTSVWGLQSPHCNHSDVSGQSWARKFPLGIGQHHTRYKGEPWHSLNYCY